MSAAAASKQRTATLPLRLKSIMDHLNEVIALHRPEHVAVEQVFVNVNPKSTLMLGQARGAAICTAVLNNLAVAEYTALQIKQAVVGNGHAKKEQVQEMVRRLLRLERQPQRRRGRCACLRHLPCSWRAGPGQDFHAGYRMKRGRLV